MEDYLEIMLSYHARSRVAGIWEVSSALVDQLSEERQFSILYLSMQVVWEYLYLSLLGTLFRFLKH